MSNIEITNIDLGTVEVKDGSAEFEQALVTFAGTDSFPKGTLLARHTTTQKYIPYVKGGSSNGNGVVRGILTYDIARTGAGDLAARVMISGKINQDRMIIDLDGDDSNVDGVVRDLCRAAGIIPVDVTQMARYDNPQPSELDS